LNLGANPPSSPTAVTCPSFESSDFREWKVSVAALNACLKESKPAGTIMNSCISKPLSACFPPFITFIIGTGRTLELIPPRYLYKGMPKDSAAARATAMDTARIALAPSFPLFSVPSRSIIILSISTWSKALSPTISLDIISFMFSTALRVPFPLYLFLSPSLSSRASNLPVDAPDGTIAIPLAPEVSTTSASTVGFPLESRTSLACTEMISS